MGEKIRVLREEAGMTKQELEKALGIGNGTVGNWELGQCNPSLTMLQKVAKFFDKPIEYFLDDES